MTQKEWWKNILSSPQCGSGTVYNFENWVLISYFMS